MKKKTEEYAIIGWLIFVVLGFVIDIVLIFNNTCLGKYFGFQSSWWEECKSLASVIVIRTNPVNLGDLGLILSFAVIGLLVGAIYGKIKNRKGSSMVM